jgi:hypothetical protein
MSLSASGGGINTGAAFGINIPIDYTSRDYQSILSDLLTLVPTFTPEWSASSPSDFGVLLLELWAYIGDIDNYYIDRIANESFLTTAQQRSSVLNIAALIDYSPADAASSTAYMTLTVLPNTAEFVLPIYSQFASPATTTTPSIVFETLEPYTIAASGATGLITSTDITGNPIAVYQGVTTQNEAVGTSNGTASQQFTLQNTGVVGGSVDVSVNQGAGYSAWVEVNSLIDSGPYDAVYVISIDANGVVYINFGDGNNGAIPNPQATIEATYIVGGGAAGNVGAQQISDDLTGTGNFASVTNVNPAVGGSDAETIAQIQANAPSSLTAADRCVTVQDYATVAEQYSGVSMASAVAALGTSVTIYVHPAGGPYVIADLTSLVDDPVTGLGVELTNPAGTGYLDTRKMAGTTVTVSPPIYDTTIGYMPLHVTITIQVEPQFAQLTVVRSVQTALGVLYGFATMGFGQYLPLSALYTAVQAVPGVAYLTVSEFRRGDATAGTLGDVVCGPSEIPVIVVPDTGSNGLTITPNGGL